MNSLYYFIVFKFPFSWYKEDIICLISFSKFSDVFPAFNCAWAIRNLWSICLGLNIFSPFPYFALCLDSVAIKKYLLITGCLGLCSSDLNLSFHTSFRVDLNIFCSSFACSMFYLHFTRLYLFKKFLYHHQNH